MAKRRSCRFFFAIALMCFLLPEFSLAQEPYFKGKTIRIIAGFPGG
jgi:hypothetical protein